MRSFHIISLSSLQRIRYEIRKPEKNWKLCFRGMTHSPKSLCPFNYANINVHNSKFGVSKTPKSLLKSSVNVLLLSLLSHLQYRFLKNNPLIIQSLMLPMDLGNQQTLPTRRRRRCHAWVVVVVASPELVMD